MKKRVLGRSIALVAAYMAAILLLVVIQFPVDAAFGDVFGPVSFKGRGVTGGSALESVEIRGAGLKFAISRASPVAISFPGGKRVDAVPLSYAKTGNGFSVQCTEGVRLVVSVSGDSFSLAVIAAPGAVSARFAVKPYGRVHSDDENGTVRIVSGGDAFLFGGGTIDKGAKSVTCALKDGKSSVAFERVDATATQATQFIAQAPMDPAAYRGAIDAYLGRAWAGLSGAQFDRANLRWSFAQTGSNAVPKFTERAFLAYVAEAIRRGQRDAANEAIAVAAATYGSELSYLSVPFAGNTVARMTKLEETDLQEVKRLQKLIQDRSPDIFYLRDIIPFLFDRSPHSLALEAMSVARDYDFAQASIAQAVRIVEDYLDARKYLPEDQNPFAKAQSIADRALPQAVRKTDSGFFLQTGGDGLCDLAVGLDAGFALMGLGEALGKDIYTGIGQSIVTSALALADDKGNLPSEVIVRSGVAAKGSATMTPDAVYPYVNGTRYYPHAVSYYKEIGPGAWVWTTSPSFTVTVTPEETIFKSEYPELMSHYLTIYGIKPFTTIQLYGLDYRMDAAFETYNASGFFYRREANVMHVKMKHKSALERIRLIY